MAICRYCGRRAGFFRSQHGECAEHHKRAISMIPGFFEKMLASQLSAERFTELLQDTAKASFVKRDELISLCKTSLGNVIDSILKERPATIAEGQRIADLTDTLEAAFSESFGLNEKLVKASIISELYDGRIPDPISVVGPMPFEFGRGETILWIFNHVSAFRVASDKTDGGIQFDATELPKEPYFGPAALGNAHAPLKGANAEGKGDMVLTNRNIHFFLSEEAKSRIPIARIQSLISYKEAIHVVSNPARKKSPMYVLDDAWFAANVIGRLVKMVHR